MILKIFGTSFNLWTCWENFFLRTHVFLFSFEDSLACLVPWQQKKRKKKEEKYNEKKQIGEFPKGWETTTGGTGETEEAY
jgi:hypothetical protein